MMLTLALLLLIAFAILYSLTDVGSLTRKRTRMLIGIAFLIISTATAWSKLPLHIAVVGCFFLGASLTRFFAPQAVVALRRFGLLAIASALLVLIVGLFRSPISDESEIEDRNDFVPAVEVTRSPAEMLATPWSTRDRNCSWPVASLMLDLCEIAYMPPVEARLRLSALGMDSESINAGSMQGYVIDAGDDSIIILRGTEAHEYDVLQDLRFLKAKTDQGSMHGGFVKGYGPMHAQVVALLKQYNTKRAWLTGHSLGGGLAIVCAHQLLVDAEYPIAGVMTFGQPKVVRDDMKRFLEPLLNGKYVFFVNDMDPVTRVVDPYLHFGHMVRWNDNDIERSSHRSLFGSSDGATGTSNSESGYVEDMNDSELDKYIDKLESPAKPKYDQDGNLIVEGYVPSGYDHYLASYREMLETLRTHSTKSDGK